MADPQPPNTILTFTLPTPDGGGIAPERATATLHIQRGDLAHIRQFTYTGLFNDIRDAMRESSEALNELETHPPPDVTFDKPETPSPKSSAKRKSKSKPKASAKQKAQKPAATATQSEPVQTKQQPDPEPEEVEDWLKPFKQQKVVNR